jgi:cytochrome P450
MPLTQIGRVCREHTALHGVTVPAGGRVGLCWAAANHDEGVFDAPDEVRLDRKPNPHVSFGIGPHLCLGAAHARLIVRTLLTRLCQQVERIEIIESEKHLETEQTFTRVVGFAKLRLRLYPMR